MPRDAVLQEPQAPPWPAGLAGAPPSPSVCPTLGICLLRRGGCWGCRRTRALSHSPCHPGVQSRATGTVWSQRGAQPQGPLPHRQHFPPLCTSKPWHEGCHAAVSRSPDSEHPLTHSTSMALHQGHCSRLSLPAPQGAAGQMLERRGDVGCVRVGTAPLESIPKAVALLSTLTGTHLLMLRDHTPQMDRGTDRGTDGSPTAPCSVTATPGDSDCVWGSSKGWAISGQARQLSAGAGMPRGMPSSLLTCWPKCFSRG